MDISEIVSLEDEGKGCVTVEEFMAFLDKVEELHGDKDICFVCPCSNACSFSNEYVELLRKKGVLIREDDVDDCAMVFEAWRKIVHSS